MPAQPGGPAASAAAGHRPRLRARASDAACTAQNGYGTAERRPWPRARQHGPHGAERPRQGAHTDEARSVTVRTRHRPFWGSHPSCVRATANNAMDGNNEGVQARTPAATANKRGCTRAPGPRWPERHGRRPTPRTAANEGVLGAPPRHGRHRTGPRRTRFPHHGCRASLGARSERGPKYEGQLRHRSAPRRRAAEEPAHGAAGSGRRTTARLTPQYDLSATSDTAASKAEEVKEVE